MTQLLWTRHAEFPDAKAPLRAHTTDAGFDLFTAKAYQIEPGQTAILRTGICVHPQPFQEPGKAVIVPGGYNQEGGWTYACLVWDKSGLAQKGFTILGGVIDDPYTGEIMIIGTYLSSKFLGLKFEKHQKIANLLVQRVELPRLVFSEQLSATARGNDGFGSTGSV